MCADHANDALGLVPVPGRITAAEGRPVTLGGSVVIAAAPEMTDEARWFRRVLEAGTGWATEIAVASRGADVVLRIDESLSGTGTGDVPGAYRLEAHDDVVTVTGADRTGVFYGLQTLRQLLPAGTLRRAPSVDPTPPATVGPIVIEDRARCAWRGVHLDVSRHFMPKGFVLDLIDAAALHKCNVFHFHLTDDQGWRIPIDRYPRLVEVGAWRRQSPVGHARGGVFDGVPYGGAYTKDDLREIVAFAAERHVTVVPEIDMPGHMAAAIAAYPELGTGPGGDAAWTQWGVCSRVLNLEERTIEFCTDVIDEVLEIFPGPYFHMGGDECPTTEWIRSARGKALMADEGFTRPRQLQPWFTRRIADHVRQRGRTLVGWDEVLEEGAPAGTVIMVWRSLEAAYEGARAGHEVVLTPENELYFDWSSSDDPAEPLAIRGSTSTQDVYAFDPALPELAIGDRHHVVGAQCALWTEYVPTPARAGYQYFPRLCAFAETVWSPPTDGTPRDYAAFEARLRVHLGRLSAMGMEFRPLEGPTPGQSRTWPGST